MEDGGWRMEDGRGSPPPARTCDVHAARPSSAWGEVWCRCTAPSRRGPPFHLVRPFIIIRPMWGSAISKLNSFDPWRLKGVGVSNRQKKVEFYFVKKLKNFSKLPFKTQLVPLQKYTDVTRLFYRGIHAVYTVGHWLVRGAFETGGRRKMKRAAAGGYILSVGDESGRLGFPPRRLGVIRDGGATLFVTHDDALGGGVDRS